MSSSPPGRRLLLGGLLGLIAGPAAAKARKAKPAQAKPAKTKPAPSARRAPSPLVVIDPGHGGQDPGAIGLAGTMEKTVTLATALELQRQLEAHGRYRVRLTRTSDTSVELSRRLAFARAQGASLLISLHADSANHNPRAHGASVYIRSGAAPARRVGTRPREIARALAGAPPSHEPSRRFQADLLDSLGDDIALTPAPSRAAHLYVLASGIPSVLLEMGFLSNRHDEAALRDPAHRRVIARAVVEAVDAYFARLRATPDRQT